MIFQQLNQNTDVVSGRIQSVTTGLWSNAEPVANNFYLLQGQTAYTGSGAFDVLNGAYYFNVYDQDPNVGSSTEQTAEIQFSLAYGNINGSGSLLDLSQGSTNVSKTVYSQYRNILLDPNDPLFTFSLSGSASTGYDSSDVYVINFSTLRFKEQLDTGVIQFNLSGSKVTFSFIDDSFLNPSTVGLSGRVYNIINGTLDSGSLNNYDTLGRGFGLFYPDVGIIVLNPIAIANVVGTELLPVAAIDQYYQNQNILFNALNAGAYFQARSTELVPTTNYFIRVTNQNFNFSNNPTFVTTDGQLLFPQFSTDPQVYITTVGLYDDNNDLIAVAKLSQPVLKTFSNEQLIKVCLNF
jgi:hypothetical protein